MNKKWADIKFVMNRKTDVQSHSAIVPKSFTISPSIVQATVKASSSLPQYLVQFQQVNQHSSELSLDATATLMFPSSESKHSINPNIVHPGAKAAVSSKPQIKLTSLTSMTSVTYVTSSTTMSSVRPSESKVPKIENIPLPTGSGHSVSTLPKLAEQKTQKTEDSAEVIKCRIVPTGKKLNLTPQGISSSGGKYVMVKTDAGTYCIPTTPESANLVSFA